MQTYSNNNAIFKIMERYLTPRIDTEEILKQHKEARIKCSKCGNSSIKNPKIIDYEYPYGLVMEAICTKCGDILTTSMNVVNSFDEEMQERKPISQHEVSATLKALEKIKGQFSYLNLSI